MSNLKVTTINDKDGGSNAVLYGVAAPTGSMGFRNRILNGDCRIDQRNAGAATANTISGYTLDRWAVSQSTTGKLIAQQNAGSVTPPAGFTNYLGVTSQSAFSVGSGDYYMIYQMIEGYNVADFGLGAAGAATFTISFWVRSSLTGTFGGSLQNNANNRSYPFTYTISAANTWEQKTVTVAGDTTGTWEKTNSTGLRLNFGLGVGSTYSGTAGSWAGSNLITATGATSVVGTNGATFYITGVQLEAGTVASPFERRDYGRELMMCQRYYEVGTGYQSIRNPSLGDNHPFSALVGTGFQIAKRAAPTIALGTATTSGCYTNSGNTFNITTQSFAQVLLCLTGGTQSNMTITQPWTAAIEL